MNKIFKLYNQFKHYDWGSVSAIPQFLGIENCGASAGKSLPYAEMWLGTYLSAPSKIDIDGKLVNLSEISGDLPFLFKLLAVEKQLSIQAHPSIEQAQKGFNREENAGIDINAPQRSYKDANHKPEIICALTPFKMLAGFREPQIIYDSFKELADVLPQLKEIIFPLISSLQDNLFDTECALSEFFKNIFNLDAQKKKFLCKALSENNHNQSGLITQEQWLLIKVLSKDYPQDTGVLALLYLNSLMLNPYQALYIPAGIIYSYVNGFGIELMSKSDNVLRGGLTSKYIDADELTKILVFKPFSPQVITPAQAAENPDSSVPYFCYETPCKDFTLSLMQSSSPLQETVFPAANAVCIVTDGEVFVSGNIFKKGDSFFVPSASLPTEKIIFKGKFTLFAAAQINSGSL